MAKLVDNSFESLSKCAEYLIAGELVAFPTETVYGLGASLWNNDALNAVFIAKKRPKTDPLIVHVQNQEEAKKLVSLKQNEEECFNVLTKKFWPGPLTIILRSASIVPKIVMAGGAFVGIRAPSHKTAQQLLSLSKVPIAAPSANTFGHVSPTKSYHVFDDLKDVSDLWIIDDDTKCDIGIESTVIKIEDKTIELLRPGLITASKIQKEITENKLDFLVIERKKYIENEKISEKQERNKNVSRETFLENAPGQCLTHYSPWVETYIIFDPKTQRTDQFPLRKKQKLLDTDLNISAIVDFGKQYLQYRNIALSYSDLSEVKDIQEAAQKLFIVLRTIEKIQGIKKILIANILFEDDFANALFDRIYRAASGKFVEI